MRTLKKYLLLPLPEKLIITRLLLLLIRAELIFRLLPYSVSRRYIFKKNDLSLPAQENQKGNMYKQVRLLGSLCRHLPWKPTCLRIAAALRDSLRKKGIGSVIKLGVCQSDNGLLAHAWLECCGTEVLKNREYSEFNSAGRHSG